MAGTATVDPLEFLARVLTHIPDPGQVMTRYYGCYANWIRGLALALRSGRHPGSDAGPPPSPPAGHLGSPFVR